MSDFIRASEIKEIEERIRKQQHILLSVVKELNKILEWLPATQPGKLEFSYEVIEPAFEGVDIVEEEGLREDASDTPVNQVSQTLSHDILRDVLLRQRHTGYVTMKPKDWLGRDRWRQINHRIRQLSGEWISDGEDSHWVIPIPEDPEKDE